MQTKLFAAVQVHDATDEVRVQLPRQYSDSSSSSSGRHHRGWRRLVSINAVPTARLLLLAREHDAEHYAHELNALLPTLLASTDAPLPEDGDVDVCIVATDDAAQEEHVTLHYSMAARAAVQAAVRCNFAGILAVGKAAGLTEQEVTVLFGATMLEYAKAAATAGDGDDDDDDDDDDNNKRGGAGAGRGGAHGVDLHDMMGNMMDNMMGAGAARHAAGQAAGGQNCQAQ